MKKTCFFIVSILFVSAFVFAQRSNDLVRYGLLGHVKTMQQKVYNYCQKNDDQWSIVDTSLYSQKKYSYNEQGILESMQDRQVNKMIQNPTSMTIKFSYENEKISGSEWRNEKNEILGKSVVKWKNDSSYIDVIKDDKTATKIETYHLLDNLGRNKQTVTKRYLGEKLDGFVTSSFAYTANTLSNVLVIDSIRKVAINYNVITLQKDPVGNVTESVMYPVPDNKSIPAIITQSRYEYYIK
jgi:hypothetical protein